MLNTEIPFVYPEKQALCIVTVDTATGTNLIVWDRVQDAGIDHYNIYREGYAPDEYLLVAAIEYNDITEYNDTVASPFTRSWRYKISAVDSCDNESELSDNHKTIHLNMNLGLSNAVNLIWDDYEGFDYTTFYINRHTNSEGWKTIDSLPRNLHSYSDNPSSMEGLWYTVTVKAPHACISSSRSMRASGGPYYQSVSNLEDEGIANTGHESDAIKEINQYIDIYPNPTKGKFIVAGENILSIEITNADGKRLQRLSVSDNKTSIDLGSYAKGLYFVKVIAKEAVLIKKIVLE